MPTSLRGIWPIFVHLSATRSYEQGMPLPIKDSEILAWAALHGRRPNIGTLKALRVLDTVWLRVMAKARSAT